MMRHLRIGVVVLAAAFIASGCVSSGTFKKMEAGKNQEIAALQQEKAQGRIKRSRPCSRKRPPWNRRRAH